MATVALGQGAYERLYAGEPVVRMENRFIEANPTNLKEHTALLARPGTTPLRYFGGGAYRRAFTERGMFDSDLFVVCGANLWRWSGSGTPTFITGAVQGDGPPSVAWVKGAGYQRLFIADGLLLQYYDGGTPATGTLTKTVGALTDEVVRLGPTYYTFNDAVDAGSPDGTVAKPWRVRKTGDPVQNLADTLTYAGTPGTTFSTAIGGPNLLLRTATAAGGPPATSMAVASTSEGVDGNSIVTAVTGTTPLLAWGAGTLTGGGVHVLHGITVPGGVGAKAVCGLKGYCLVAVADSQTFYWVNPGEVVIDALDFASKESFADNIQDILRVGDTAMLVGESSTESWYPTGDLAAPFAPVQGRTYNRGAVAGTTVVIKDSVLLVGDDGVVYQLGGGNAGNMTRISNHGIEERVRRQLRREKGLAP